jgi:hypothetical protein
VENDNSDNKSDNYNNDSQNADNAILQGVQGERAHAQQQQIPAPPIAEKKRHQIRGDKEIHDARISGGLHELVDAADPIPVPAPPSLEHTGNDGSLKADSSDHGNTKVKAAKNVGTLDAEGRRHDIDDDVDFHKKNHQGGDDDYNNYNESDVDGKGGGDDEDVEQDQDEPVDSEARFMPSKSAKNKKEVKVEHNGHLVFGQQHHHYGSDADNDDQRRQPAAADDDLLQVLGGHPLEEGQQEEHEEHENHQNEEGPDHHHKQDHDDGHTAGKVEDNGGDNNNDGLLQPNINLGQTGGKQQRDDGATSPITKKKTMKSRLGEQKPMMLFDAAADDKQQLNQKAE